MQHEAERLIQAHAACKKYVMQPLVFGSVSKRNRRLSVLITSLYGDTLATALSSRAEVHSPGEESFYATAVLHCSTALDALHSLTPPILHRDVKALNLLSEQHSFGTRWVLCDFGSAKQAETFTVQSQRQADEVEDDACRHTSPTLRAPEQWQPYRKIISPAIDVWAVGVLLYRILYGVEPFADGSSSRVLTCTTLPPLWERSHSTDDKLASLCQDCLAIDANQRPPIWRVQQILADALSASDQQLVGDATPGHSVPSNAKSRKQSQAHSSAAAVTAASEERAVQVSVLPESAQKVLKHNGVDCSCMDVFDACDRLANLLQGPDQADKETQSDAFRESASARSENEKSEHMIEKKGAQSEISDATPSPSLSPAPSTRREEKHKRRSGSGGAEFTPQSSPYAFHGRTPSFLNDSYNIVLE